jgi:hypothetical protein
MSRCAYHLTFLVAGFVGISISGSTYAVMIRTVALSGQFAPGTPAPVRFSSFGWPVLNASGETAFLARLEGPGLGISHEGYWSEGPGALELVAHHGEPAPGTSLNYQSFGFRTPALNNAGQVAFQGFISGVAREGRWLHDSSSTELIVRAGISDGEQAPGTPSGVNFLAIGPAPVTLLPPLLNAAGKTSFRGFLTGATVTTSNNQGIWSTEPSLLALLARSGDQAPGTPGGTVFQSFTDPTLSDSGKTAFNAMLTGAGVTMDNDDGIWLGAVSNVELVARSGSQAPGTSSGVHFQGFNPPRLNAAGVVAFRAGLIGGGTDASNNVGIWTTRSGNLDLAVRTGNVAPGAPSGAVFSQFLSEVINDADQIAFRALLVGGGLASVDDEGIWLEELGSIRLIAREGTHAPGTAGGVNFRTFNSPVLNAAGQVAFEGTLFGSGIDNSNNQGIWVTRLNGTLQLIARRGDQIEVAPSVFRTIETLAFQGDSGNGDGRSNGFNDRGEVAFVAIFTDGSHGVFVSDAVAIPEPITLTLVGIMSLAGYICGARRRSVSTNSFGMQQNHAHPTL